MNIEIENMSSQRHPNTIRNYFKPPAIKIHSQITAVSMLETLVERENGGTGVLRILRLKMSGNLITNHPTSLPGTNTNIN